MSDFIVEEVDEDKNIVTHNPNYQEELKQMKQKITLLECDEAAKKILNKHMNEEFKSDFEMLFKNPEEFV